MGKADSKCLDEISKYIPKLSAANEKINSVTNAAIQKINNPPEKRKRTFQKDYYNDELSRLNTEATVLQKDQQYGQDKLLRSREKYNAFRILGDPNAVDDDGIIKNNVNQYYNANLDKFKTNSKQIYERSMTQHASNIKDLTTLNNYYLSQEAYSKRMYDILDTKKKEVGKLQEKLDSMSSKGLTEGRKAVYEISAKDNLESVQKVLYYIYYFLFIMYLIFGRFFLDEEYRSVRVWIFILLYVTLPFYLTYISRNLIYLYRQFLYIKDNTLPKNVYSDI